jgi:hypothetical protein
MLQPPTMLQHPIMLQPPTMLQRPIIFNYWLK